MGKKLLLAMVITFLVMAVAMAFYSDGSLAGARPYYLGDVVLYSVVAFPLAAAIVLWEHNSSRALKYLSAGTGFITTLILVLQIGPVATQSSEFKTSLEVVYRSILILSCFIFLSTFISIAGRFSIWLCRVFQYLTLKLKNLSRALLN